MASQCTTGGESAASEARTGHCDRGSAGVKVWQKARNPLIPCDHSGLQSRLRRFDSDPSLQHHVPFRGTGAAALRSKGPTLLERKQSRMLFRLHVAHCDPARPFDSSESLRRSLQVA